MCTFINHWDVLGKNQDNTESMKLSHSPPLSVWDRLAAAPGVLASFTLSCVLLILNSYGYAARGGIVDFTVSNRANLQVLVHVLA